MLKALKSVQNNKSPGIDCLTKGFSNEIKNLFMNSFKKARDKKKLRTSQRQAVINLNRKERKR